MTEGRDNGSTFKVVMFSVAGHSVPNHQKEVGVRQWGFKLHWNQFHILDGESAFLTVLSR